MAKLLVLSQGIYQDELKNLSNWAFTGKLLLFVVLYVRKRYKENSFKQF